jgi:hypothetical protein
MQLILRRQVRSLQEHFDCTAQVVRQAYNTSNASYAEYPVSWK